MAGFVTPSVNISLFMKRPANFDIAINLDNQTSQDNFKLHEYYNSSTNSNSNDSYPFESDGYSSEASSSAFDTSFSNTSEMNSSRGKKGSVATSKSRKTNQSASTSSQQKPKKSTGGGRKPNRNDKVCCSLNAILFLISLITICFPFYVAHPWGGAEEREATWAQQTCRGPMS